MVWAHALTLLAYLEDEGAPKRALLEESEALDRQTNDTRTRAFSLRGLAELTFHNAASARLRAERLACTRLAGDPWLIARILAASAEMAADQGDYARAKLRFAARYVEQMSVLNDVRLILVTLRRLWAR